MNITNGVPDPDSVVSDLLGVFISALEGMDKGAADARQFHELRDFNFEPDLANTIIRKWIKQALLPHKVTDEEFFINENVRLVGLRFQYGLYDIRVWKTKDGELPYPGRSLQKRQFLENRAQNLLGPSFYPSWDRVNLVLLWSVSNSYELDRSFIVLPKAAPTTFFGPAEVYWTHQLPHLAELITLLPPDQQTTQTDLPFEPQDEEEEQDTGTSQ